jgi:hypothetical protein
VRVDHRSMHPCSLGVVGIIAFCRKKVNHGCRKAGGSARPAVREAESVAMLAPGSRRPCPPARTLTWLNKNGERS